MECSLGRQVTVTIDRPLGTPHPDHGYIYPVNYGYIEGTMAADGEEVDAYVIGVYKPVKTFTGVIVAVIKRKEDKEDKLVVADRMGHYTKEQIAALVEFQERYFTTEIIMSLKQKRSMQENVLHKDAIYSVILFVMGIIAMIELINGRKPYDLMCLYVAGMTVDTYFEFRKSNSKESRIGLIGNILLLVATGLLWITNIV